MKDVKIAVPITYLSNFGEVLKHHELINKIELQLNLTRAFVMPNNTGDITFDISDVKLYSI